MHPSALVGRDDELQALTALVTRARNGGSGALVVRGDPGIGKTALLKAATGGLSGVTVIRSDGFEAELTMPFAALQRVAKALSDHIPALPNRQRQAVQVACGIEDGPAPDRFLVGLGLLGLFAEAGTSRPVVCVVDDAQWLDAESRDVLAFVARRLQAESTVLLFGARDGDETLAALAGIPDTRLTGLDTTSAVALLTSATSHAIDPHAATAIADATGGNPLALIDLTRDLSVARLTEFSLRTDPVPIGRRLEQHYLGRVADLSPQVQTWLLLAAAEPTGHAELIAAAAADLGLPVDCAAAAERAGLVTVEANVAFRHPLVRSAVYGAATGAPRRRVQGALARQAGVLGLVELEAWHAAESIAGTDRAVADRLVAVAEMARRRGGLASQANLLSRAATLTPPGPVRNDRLLAAAEAAAEVGAATLSGQLLDRLSSDDLDGIGRGRVIAMRAALALFVPDPAGVPRAPADMLAAASAFHGLDPEREQRALLQAFEYSLVTELLMTGTSLDQLGRRMAAGADVLDGPRSVLLRALSAHVLAPYAEAVPLMRGALDMLSALDDGELSDLGFVGIALATALFDSTAAAAYLARLARIAADAGALRALDTLLWVRSSYEIGRGDPAEAGRALEQVRELRRAIGYPAENVVNVAHLAWTGTAREDVEGLAGVTRIMGFGGVETAATAALATLDIASGRYAEAHRRLSQMVAEPFLQVTYFQLANYVEAAVRSGRSAEAGTMVARIADMADASRTAWLGGLAHRCRALVAGDDDAELHYRLALESLGAAGVPADLGRAHLLYGEWLRRMKRRRDARTQLRAAVDVFDRIEAPAFAARARAELTATGEATTHREVIAGVELSPREAAVARLAADGRTNAEIGTTLFISANTVDYHLRKVFAKLGVSSRRQLGERFASGD